MCGGSGPSAGEIAAAAQAQADAERAKLEAEKELEKFKEEQTILRQKTSEAQNEAMRKERQKRLTVLGAAEEEDSPDNLLGGY